MSETIQNGNLQDILNIIKRTNETFSYEIYVPSLDKNIRFREINTSQQKRLLKSIIDSNVYNTEFIFTFRELIKENCIDKIDIDTLNIFDKLIIALNMRAMSIGDILKISLKSEKTGKTIEKEISLTAIANKALKDVVLKSEVLKDEKGLYEITCDLPTIMDEYKLETELHKNIDNDKQDIKKTIGEIFINELVKYIKVIVINDLENKQQYELHGKDMTFKDKIKLVESLPVNITKNIINYITNINKEFEKVILINEEIDGEIFEQRLKVDASFFTIS